MIYQSTEDGYVTQKMLDYYGERAAGGNISMIITGYADRRCANSGSGRGTA